MISDEPGVAALLDLACSAEADATRAASLVRAGAFVEAEVRAYLESAHPLAVAAAHEGISPRTRRACEIALGRDRASGSSDAVALPPVRLSENTSSALAGIVSIGAPTRPRPCPDYAADRLALRLLDAGTRETAAIERALGLVEVAFICSHVYRTTAGRVLQLAETDPGEMARWADLAPPPDGTRVERSADRIAALAARGLAGAGLVLALGHGALGAALTRAEAALASAALSRLTAPPPAAEACDDAWLAVVESVVKRCRGDATCG